MIIKAPAKINIGLKIINKRDDGFHNLETIFYPINLSDELNISITPVNKGTNSVFLKSNNHILPSNKANICYKAIESFFRTFKIHDNYIIKIYINKNIPIGGGLGGGSSDAAAVLKVLIKYFSIDIKKYRNEILNIAVSVGSDVPFFLIQKPCFAYSRGEKMNILNEFNLNGYSILLVNPNMHISTKWAFETINLSEGIINKSDLKSVRNFDSADTGIYENDFEKIVFEKYKELENIKQELINFGAVFSSLSGSGATLFGIFNSTDPEKIKECFEYYKSKQYFCFV